VQSRLVSPANPIRLGVAAALLAPLVMAGPVLAQSAGAVASGAEVMPVPVVGDAVVPPPEPAVLEPGAEPNSSNDIVVSSQSRKSRADPLAGANAVSFAAVQAVDQAVIEPAAKGYEKALPEPVRDGVHNALYNLREPVIAVNFLLQHKVGKAGETLARLAINSTLGVAGLFDFARRKPFRLPHRANGFGNTLGFYGVGPGPYMFLPLWGPMTARDFTGAVLDRMTLPLMIGGSLSNPVYTVPLIVLSTLDRRLVNDERMTRLREGPIDPYVATREDYLRRRRAEIDALRAGTEGAEDPKDELPRTKR